MEIERYAILNDIHFPFEEKQRYEIALNIMKAIHVNHIYLNGDIGEFQGVSHWPIHPTDKNINLFAELNYMNKKFDELQELFPNIPVTYICGNHEYRLFRFIRDTAPQIWGVMPDCPTLLNFEKRPGWKFVDYGNDQLVRCGKSNLYLRHEPIGRGVSHAKATAEASLVDIAYGHTHTYQSYTHRKFGPTPVSVICYSLGWLGDKSRNVFDYRGPKDVWHLGFTIVECESKSGKYSLDFISLESIPVFYKGKKFDLKNK